MKTQYSHPAYAQTRFHFLKFISVCILSGTALWSSDVFAHPIVQSWQNQMGSLPGLKINPRFTLLNSTQNFDSIGTSYSFGNKLQRYYFDVLASYGFSENFFIYGRLSALYTSVSGIGINEQGNLGLSDQMLGSTYRLYESESGFSLNLQGEVVLPAYDNSSAKVSNKPYLGDGSIDMTIGGFLEIPILRRKQDDYFIEAGAGYTYRSKGFSQSIPWNIQIKRYPLEEGFSFSAGARGTTSLETDITNLSESALAAGGSYLINAINPSWALAQASLGYQPNKQIEYSISGAYPVFGKSAPLPLQVSIGFQFSFEHTPTSEAKSKRKSIHPENFRQYDLDSKVTSFNDQLYMIKIDKGSNSGINKGQIFDIFSGENIVAQARVTNVKSDESILRVLEYFKEQSIEIDAIARRVIQQP